MKFIFLAILKTQAIALSRHKHFSQCYGTVRAILSFFNITSHGYVELNVCFKNSYVSIWILIQLIAYFPLFFFVENLASLTCNSKTK